ncbi:hypothetical protein GAO09_08515 [Rhizobiales bacterium RZME27]|uniref:Uncharacterized protein n=1 Tax=Endobacterium cereale TaxID=2663029 RepID=A0A6A8A887_9HYPH|nr:hypothetical protein [Endobacterium cereale]MEB2848230.1 hypothetical protein [Endobacterium cereale]MQY46097.1 hypothetical protein [Endobacterium cereale]
MAIAPKKTSPVDLKSSTLTGPDPSQNAGHAQDDSDAFDHYCSVSRNKDVDDAADYSELSVDSYHAPVDVKLRSPLADRIEIVGAHFCADIGGSTPAMHVAFSISVDQIVVHETLEWVDVDLDLVTTDAHLDYGDDGWLQAVTKAASVDGLDSNDVRDDVGEMVIEKLKMAVAALKAKSAYDSILDRLAKTAARNKASDLSRISHLVSLASAEAARNAEMFETSETSLADIDLALAGSRFSHDRNRDQSDWVTDTLTARR